MRLLLISSSTASGYAYLEYPKPYIKKFLGQQVIKVAFVPFAGLKQSYENLVGYDAYEKKIIEFLEVNREVVVAGLREGMMFRIEDDHIRHEGVSDKPCRIFKYGQSPVELGRDDDFSNLLK